MLRSNKSFYLVCVLGLLFDRLCQERSTAPREAAVTRDGGYGLHAGRAAVPR